ncbi:F5/8 type C domain-containing protein [Lachnotalea glycerini]|uniref:F5/8 type C domain-containing protein n=2 Tax=Lachnotalea glycerini TaxID=1763509 RepID=A0A318ENK3_9FIRM|nr:DUF6055 domain-containing protein [Lachnotalea glycerini]PXV86319.1 F5/8 type C domain-containing protein [Lachnotalea glycerini]
MNLKKSLRFLAGVVLSAAMIGGTHHIKAVAAEAISSSESTYVTRDGFYDLDDSSVNRLSSEHFQIIWGNNYETGTVTEELVRGNLENLESIRDFYVNVLGFYDTSVSIYSNVNSSTHYKTNLYINKTGLTKIEDNWAYMSNDRDGFAYMAVQPGAMRVDPPSWVIPHEYAHAITLHQRGNVSSPWYEVTANWFRDQYLGSTYYKYGSTIYGPTSDFFQPIILNSECYFPHMKNYYDAWPFLVYVSENPDHMTGLGMELMVKMFRDSTDELMFDKLQRISGISTKDMLGGYARRMVTLDFDRQSSYMSYLNELLKDSANYSKIYTTLESTSDGWLKVTDAKAPQQGGYNIIPLDIDLSSETVTIQFQGDSSVSGADYRVSIVTKTTNGETRYSTMWNSGSNSITLQGDEEKAYVVVCATPDTMLDLTSYDVNAVGTKYPYQIKIATSGVINKVNNIALKATKSTSYCSDWESINALNDGYAPTSSNDRAHEVYGNWPQTGTQWVQYDFSDNYTISQCDVYWFADGQGIDVPKSYKIKYLDGSKWREVKNASGYGIVSNQYNTTTFKEVSTKAIRLELVSNGSYSTGILEWKVFGIK